jgi:hypothetical protein
LPWPSNIGKRSLAWAFRIEERLVHRPVVRVADVVDAVAGRDYADPLADHAAERERLAGRHLATVSHSRAVPPLGSVVAYERR